MRTLVPNEMIANPAVSILSAPNTSGPVSIPTAAQVVGVLRVDGALDQRSYIEQTAIATPGAAATGTVRLYPKADGNFYKMNSSGVESPIAPSVAGLYLPLTGGTLTGSLLFSPDNTYNIGGSTSTFRPNTIYVGSGGAQTNLVNSLSTLVVGANTQVNVQVNGSVRWLFNSSGHLMPGTNNANDIGSTGTRPRDLWVGRNLDVAGVTTFPDLGADTPSAKFQGMAAFGGRLNIGGLGGADRIGFMVTGINTPSTTLMNGSTQTLWYAEYWSNDANTGVLNGMDFGCIGPPSVKVSEINLMRLRGVGARAQGPNYARGLKVESINNGTIDNIGVDIATPGSSGSGRNLSLRASGNTELQARTYIGNALDAWLERDGPSGELRLSAQSQLRLALGYGSNYVSVPGQLRIGTTKPGQIYTTEGAANALLLTNFDTSGIVQIAGAMQSSVVANAYWNGNSWSRMATGQAMTLDLGVYGLTVYSAPSAGASTPPVFGSILNLDTAGNLTVVGDLRLANQKGYKLTYSASQTQWALTSTADDYNALYCGPTGLLFTNFASTVRLGTLDNSGNLSVNGQVAGGSLSISGGGSIFGRTSFYNPSTTGIATTTASQGAFEIQPSSGGGASMLCFHRPGSFATYFGVDTDNIFRVGGWSLGAAAYRLILGDGYGNMNGLGVNGANVATNGVLFSCHANLYGGVYYSTSSQFLGWPSEGRFKAAQAALPDPLRLLDRAAISYRQPHVEWLEGEALVSPDDDGAPNWGFRAEDWRDHPELVQPGPAGIDSFNLTAMIPLTWEAVRAIYAELVALRLRVEELEHA